MQRQDGTTFYLPFKGYQGVGVTVAAQAEAAASRSLGFTFNGKPIITDADGRLILQGNTAAPTNTFINGKPLGTDSDGHLMLQGSTTTSTIATTSVSTTSTVNNNVASSSSTAPVYQGNIRVYIRIIQLTTDQEQLMCFLVMKWTDAMQSYNKLKTRLLKYHPITALRKLYLMA